MQRLLIVVLLMALVSTTAMAQHKGKKDKPKEQFRIENIVSDLSTVQKRKLSTIYEESQATLEALRNRQKQVCDSIHQYMIQSGDFTAQLHPLFEREGQLQIAISKAMYATRLRIEEVLTAEQRALVHQYFKELKEKHKKEKK